MRIDDNERREVAKKLRNLDVRKYDAYHLIHPYDVETALGLEPDDEYWFTADSVYRLADLIDRPIANEMGESMTFNDIEFKECPRCGVEPVIEDVRERSLDGANVMSVTCPACGMSKGIVWGTAWQASPEHVAAILADSWNGR